MKGMNPKGDLIALAASSGLGEPEFETTQDGPPHAPQFVCVVHVGDVTARGEGRTKRDAERHAAQAALNALQHDQDRPAFPGVPIPLPVYAEVLSQALLVAHERAPQHASVDEVRRLTVTLYGGLLRDLGVVDG